MEVKELIRSRRIELGLTMREVAAYVGVSEGTISRWESGDIENMRRSRIYALSKVLNVSPLAIMGLEEDGDYDDSGLPSNAYRFRKNKKVPLVGRIACGEPILAEENVECFLSAPDGVNADFCLKCCGDSMVGARIYDGDIVFVRQQPQVEDGEIAAVMVDSDEATLKRVHFQDDMIILRAENPQFKYKVFVGDDRAKVRILGKAVAFVGLIQ